MDRVWVRVVISHTLLLQIKYYTSFSETERSRSKKRHLRKISSSKENVGLTVKTIFHYCATGLGIPAEHNTVGDRDYYQPAIQKIVFIRRA
tara:strand:+ start:302 stop:574 length:273 start_codon:yes stop_codon:yes gene_type:complete